MADSPKLYVQQITDIYVRKNFQALQDYFAAQNQLLDFKFVELDFTAATSKQKIQHGLAVIPRDLVRLEVTGPGILQFHKGLFDKTYLIISSTDAVHARLLVGLSKDGVATQLAEDVMEEWSSKVPRLA